jgi:hypothetical protein
VARPNKRNHTDASQASSTLFSRKKLKKSEAKEEEKYSSQAKAKSVDELENSLDSLLNSAEYKKLIAHLQGLQSDKESKKMKQDLLKHKNLKLEAQVQALADSLARTIADGSREKMKQDLLKHKNVKLEAKVQALADSLEKTSTDDKKKKMRQDLLNQKDVKLEAKVQALADTLEKTVADLPLLFGRSKFNYAVPGVPKVKTDKVFADRVKAEEMFLKATTKKLEAYLKHLDKSKVQAGDTSLAEKKRTVKDVLKLAKDGHFNEFMDQWDTSSKLIEKHRPKTYFGVKFTAGNALRFPGKTLVADINKMKDEFVKKQKVVKRY